MLKTFRPLFARASTFTLVTILATNLVARTSRRTVVGMLAKLRRTLIAAP